MADFPAFKGQKQLVTEARRTPVRFPKTRHELFQLLALYDPAQGLDALLTRVDYAGIGPIDVYRAVHQRAPDSLEQASKAAGYDARQHLKAAVLSSEFRQHSTEHFLNAFPELRRDVFVHIPKCAGTDLILTLAPRRLSLSKLLDVETWTTENEWLNAISAIAQAAPLSESVFVSGHFELGGYLGRCGIRAGDKVFTIIRDPVELLISQANYAISRVIQDPERSSPDTRDILNFLGAENFEKQLSPSDVKNLAIRALLDKRIAQPNRICFYLGKDRAARYEVAMNMVVTNDIEIVTTETYSKWLSERWGIESHSRHNRSQPFLTKREVTSYYARDVEEALAEDQKFYRVLTWALQKRGGSSIKGSELAELFGGFLRSLSPASLIAPKTKPSSPPNMVAAEGNDSIAIFLEPVPAARESQLPVREINVDFGPTGQSQDYLQDGWGKPEKGFTWTVGTESRIVLPRPKIPAAHTLRILVRPFVSRGKLSSQRIALSINGTPVGVARISQASLLESDIDWELISKERSINLSFAFPDATRPSDIQHSEDTRQLALSFLWLQLLCFTPAAETEFSSSDATVGDVGNLPPSDLIKHFESLGENCEFGLVQRRCGAEPLGLLRFSSAPLAKLMAALNDRFEGMGQAETIDVQISSNGNEYMVHDLRFGFHYHAWVLVHEQSAEAVHIRETRRVPFLIQKLLEELALGEKIFVFHGMSPLGFDDAFRLHAALQKYGEGVLMWVEVADQDHPPGTVEWIAQGLLKAYIDRFAPGENAHDLSLESWITVCRKAYGMHLKAVGDRKTVA